jgi:hypothetical protein
MAMIDETPLREGEPPIEQSSSTVFSDHERGLLTASKLMLVVDGLSVLDGLVAYGVHSTDDGVGVWGMEPLDPVGIEIHESGVKASGTLDASSYVHLPDLRKYSARFDHPNMTPERTKAG